MNKKVTTDILAAVAGYYTQRIASEGASAKGVDWNGEASQYRRFEELSRIWRGDRGFTICDYGCGYGELLRFLCTRAEKPRSYTGVDVSQAMICQAKSWAPQDPSIAFECSSRIPEPVDYVVASGVFNVKLDSDSETWWDYCTQTIAHLHASSRKGIAFNMLTAWSNPEKLRDHLFYADPSAVLDHVGRDLSRSVSIIHDYDLWEFTVFVRKHSRKSLKEAE